VILCLSNVLNHSPAHWNSGTRLVALALADRVGDEWTCWPSLDDIGARTGLSRRMVKYHLRYLEAEGVIAREERRRGNGSQQSNLWVWLWINGPGGPDRVQPTAPPVGQPTAPHP
jgi:biotin operon repressor